MIPNSDEYVWEGTFRLSVHPSWIADGFNLTPERLQSRLEELFRRDLGYAYEHEIQVESKITAAPDARRLRAAQGYPSED